MNVSFTGIQNAGAINILDNQRFVCQLTDKGSKDLSEFEGVLKKFPDPLNLGFLRMDIWNYPADGMDLDFFLNNKPLKMQDENLNTFSKLAKMFKSIIESKEGFFVSKDYLEDMDCAKNFMDGFIEAEPNVIESFQQNLPFKDYHSMEDVKKSAKFAFESITESIKKFLK
ncbi:MAG: hypothetical protein WCY19_00660 [Candidatus Gastranaerophilaceae bacterium]